MLQWIEGSGTPDAVQAMTTGDSLVTVSSVGSSAIDGGTVGRTKEHEKTCYYHVAIKQHEVIQMYRSSHLEQ